MMRKKNRIIILLMVCFVILCETKALATEEVQKQYKVEIQDKEDLLTKAEEEQLRNQMEAMTEYGNMVFVSVYLSNGTDYEAVSEKTYYQIFGNEPGVLFQIDMGNRKMTISASTEMEKALGKEKDSILSNIYKQATRGEYYGCISECFAEIQSVLQGEKIAHSMKYIDNAIIALILALILNFVLAIVTSRERDLGKELFGAVAVHTAISNVSIKPGKKTRKYSPSSSGSSGGSSSGGSSGGGGGFSGGSSSHGF